MENKNSIIDTHFIQTTPPGEKQQTAMNNRTGMSMVAHSILNKKIMNSKTIYLSGPEKNFHEFEKVDKELTAMGFKVINPHVICQSVDPKLFKNEEDYWQHCMRLCIAELSAFADLLVTLTGWEDNRGAKKEVGVARELGFIPVEHIVAFLSRYEANAN
ncbi:MAG: DUF4406 domain-containing protein [Bacteroidota bacterium]